MLITKYPATPTAAIARSQSQLSGSCNDLRSVAGWATVAVGASGWVAVGAKLGMAEGLGFGVSVAGAGVGMLVAGGVTCSSSLSPG